MHTRLPLLIAAISSAINLATASEWPRWRGAGSDGRWIPPNDPADLAKREPERLWTQAIGGGFGGVTISAGRAYVMDLQKSPGARERVLCFDVSTGQPVWQHEWSVDYGSMEYGTGPRGSVVIEREDDSARAYALGARGMAVCLDAVSGRVIWQLDTQAKKAAKPPTWGFAASPFLRKDAVILHVAAQPGGCVLALDKKTGREVWRGGDDAAGYCTPELIKHGGHEQLIAWSPEHVQSLDPSSGALNWRHPYKITYGVSIAQPLYAEGILLVSGYWHGSKAFKLGATPRESTLLWEDEKNLCGLMSSPLCKNGHVYLLDKTSGLTCFELATGKIRWQDTIPVTPKERNPQISLVWLDEKNDLIALLNARGELVYARVTPERIEEVARHQIIGKTWAHPAFADSIIVARSDTELAAWRLW